MVKSSALAALLCVVYLFYSLPSHSSTSDDMDIISLMLPVLAISCNEGEFSNCSTGIGCSRINGLWDDGVCTEKPLNRQLTEQLVGLWNLSTVFPNGQNRSYFAFDSRTVERIGETENFSIGGGAHQSSKFDTPNPVPIIGAYDSTMSDWFILEFWGADIGLASLFEFEFTSENSIAGCEYFVSYPDLRYTDGICNSFNGYRVYGSGISAGFAESQTEASALETNKRSFYFKKLEEGEIDADVVYREKNLSPVRALARDILENTSKSK